MEWIKVTDEYPLFGPNNQYLFLNGKREVTFGYAYDPKDGWDAGISSIWINDMSRETNETATHFMKLPELPKEINGMD